jgi:hypothetical protein
MDGDPGGEGIANPTIYANYQAFLAKLVALEVWEASPEPAIWAMERAFSSKYLAKEPAMNGYYIIGAAQWIVWNGQGLFKMILQHDGTSTATFSDEKKPPESQQLTLELWESWVVGFNKAAMDEKVGEEASDLAQRASEIMQVLEKTMQF